MAATLDRIQFKITDGMNQDISIQTLIQKKAFRLFNVKSQSMDSSTLGDLTNEKGNSLINIQGETITGRVIGTIQCTDTMAVIFTYEASQGTINQNSIYKVTYNNGIVNIQLLARGDFHIPTIHPTTKDDIHIDGIFIYENSSIQKIYWVDGVNPLRYLNISDENPAFAIDCIKDENYLSSKPNFKLNHRWSVTRIAGGGIFTAGVIQYAFTYFNKYGAETNIVDISPLYYIAEDDRGLREDETTGCSFKVTITNPDTDFEYIRLYSIQRTSLNGIPVVKIVGDIKIE